jgi:hypothetical protein
LLAGIDDRSCIVSNESLVSRPENAKGAIRQTNGAKSSQGSGLVKLQKLFTKRLSELPVCSAACQEDRYKCSVEITS